VISFYYERVQQSATGISTTSRGAMSQSSNDRVRAERVKQAMARVTEKEHQRSRQESGASEYTVFFFGMATNNTFYVLLIHVLGYVLYSAAISMLLYIDAVEEVILGTNFSGGFSPVVFIMQMLYLKSLYDDSMTSMLFYTLLTTTRSMTLKLGAYIHGERRCASQVRAGEFQVQRGNMTTAHHPIEDCAALVDTVRGLMMVYTRYEFKIFGVGDPCNDHLRFDFEKEERAAKNVFGAIIMRDEEDTSVFDGAQFEMIAALTQLRERGVFTTSMYTEMTEKLDAIATIKDKLWMSRRPLSAPILDTIPRLMVNFYVYCLVPFVVYSSVGKNWGIPVYALVLFFYNGRNVLADWLGSPFVENARYQPLSFAKLRNQQYLMIELLLGTRNVEEYKDELDDDILIYNTPSV
jgi:hypothetical protein